MNVTLKKVDLILAEDTRQTLYGKINKQNIIIVYGEIIIYHISIKKSSKINRTYLGQFLF